MSVCWAVPPAGSQAEAPFHNKMGQIQGAVISQDGRALPNVWLMTDNGVLTRTVTDGTFTLQGLSDSCYSVKAMASGMDDAIVPGIAVSDGKPVSIRIVMTNSVTASALITGCVRDRATRAKLPAYFEITDSSGPVRWFDVAGTPYGGRTDLPSKAWHQNNKRYWSLGDFAFTARPGKLRVSVRSDGFAPVTVNRTVQPSQAESIEIGLERLFVPADEGWFKGDFHAHGVHGERFYQVNIPFMAFILRAERYHWFYLSSSFSNDGVNADPFAIARQESGEDLFLALNAEYPKTYGGHVGSLGIAPPRNPLPYPRYSNAEAIKRDIVDQGGAAIPVHPLAGHMKSRELPFIILGAPELICGFDFYTAWSEQLEKTWAMFLNRGYQLCRTATSDTAFDLGRTPGTMGATFIHPDGGRLNRENIVEAFKTGRTTLSWDGTLLLFKIDGAVCGVTFPSGKTARKAAITLLGTPALKTLIKVTRNGKPFKQFPATVPNSGRVDVAFDLIEQEKAWYTAICATEGTPEKVIAATSPFYFGDWTPPALVFAEVEARVFDVDTKKPLDAALTLIDPGKPDTPFRAQNGVFRLQARVFQRLKASAEGYADLENGILDTPAVNTFIAAVSEEDLQAWKTYEKACGILQTLTVDFPMRRR